MIIGGWRGPGWRVADAGPGCGKQVRDWIASAIARHGALADPADAALAFGELFFPGFESVSPKVHPRSFSYLPAESSRRPGQDAGRQQ